MEMELLKWSVGLNVFLFLVCVGGIITGMFWGLSVGQRLGRGESITLFGGRMKGEVFQAPESEDLNPAAYQAEGASAMDPLSLLDEHINRNLKQMGAGGIKSHLLDPDLAGQAPVQAGRGGE